MSTTCPEARTRELTSGPAPWGLTLGTRACRAQVPSRWPVVARTAQGDGRADQRLAETYGEDMVDTAFRHSTAVSAIVLALSLGLVPPAFADPHNQPRPPSGNAQPDTSNGTAERKNDGGGYKGGPSRQAFDCDTWKGVYASAIQAASNATNDKDRQNSLSNARDAQGMIRKIC